jgi:hypothetical protein
MRGIAQVRFKEVENQNATIEIRRICLSHMASETY